MKTLCDLGDEVGGQRGDLHHSGVLHVSLPRDRNGDQELVHLLLANLRAVRVACCVLRVASCVLRVANCELRIANCELRIAY